MRLTFLCRLNLVHSSLEIVFEDITVELLVLHKLVFQNENPWKILDILPCLIKIYMMHHVGLCCTADCMRTVSLCHTGDCVHTVSLCCTADCVHTVSLCCTLMTACILSVCVTLVTVCVLSVCVALLTACILSVCVAHW